MALLRVALWASATLWQLSACERPVMKQMPCGTPTAVQVPQNSQKIIVTPNFPLNYGPSKLCTWNYITATSNVLKVSCVVNIPCSDNLLLSFSSTRNKTYCGLKAFQETVGNAVTISLGANSNSSGGYGMCTVSAAVSPPALKPGKQTTKRATEKPSKTSPKPKTTNKLARTTAAGKPATPAKNPLTTTRKVATTTTTGTNSETPSDSSKCTCSIQGSNRIPGGELAGEQEFPWMVMVLDRDFDDAALLCTGSIVAPRWVVTIASCDSIHTAAFVSAGRYNVYENLETGQLSAISAIYKHPSYNSSKPDNDIALIQLATPFNYSSMVSPVCLPVKFPTYDFSDQIGIAVGWGDKDGVWAPGYRKVSIPILTSTDCKTIPRVASLVTNNMLCTYETGKEPCQHDQGGPLHWADPISGRLFLAGIMSWELGCNKSDIPDIYTKVNNYLPWIQQTTGLTFCNP